MERPRIVVLISGSGSNLQALIDASADGTLPAHIAAVVSNRVDAFGLQRAQRAGIATAVIEQLPDEERPDYDTRLADAVDAYRPDWVVLAGWMRILTMKFLGRFPDRVVNLHPALPGDLPGTHAIERAWTDAVDGHRTSTGVMVHLVPDEGVDDGPVLATQTVPIDASGTLEEFEASIHAVEHRLLVDTLATLCTSAFTTENT